MREDSDFLSLFPHRYDFLYADHPPLGHRPQWKTEHRYPLSDRLIQRGDQLVGVRFGPTTRYILLDIDSGSPHHPQQNPYGINALLAALEPLGLVAYVACISSHSGGLHLYFPFEVPQVSQRLAHAVKAALQQAGVILRAGQLELFPNPRPYSRGTTLFNGHRLPLQSGSYLLNAGFYPIWTSPEYFVEQWHQCEVQNDVTAMALRRALKQERRQYVVSGKANKFLNDLNADIEPGWTRPSQTNHLLGRIALRSYVFGHVLSGGEPLSGRALVDDIVAIARGLPGYGDWCQHRHEIDQRAAEWARCVENSKYYPYGAGRQRAKPTEAKRNWNQEQFSKTAAKIHAAVKDLIQTGLPKTPTARFKALLRYGIGGGSLYRHKDLWHPDWVKPTDANPPVECGYSRELKEDLNSLDESAGAADTSTDLFTTSTHQTDSNSQTSFLPPADGNPSAAEACDPVNSPSAGGNPCPNPCLPTTLESELSRSQLPQDDCFLRLWRSRQRVSSG